MTDKLSPNEWQVAKFADVGMSEEFVREFVELFDIIGATTIVDDQRSGVTDAIGTTLTDGLIPAFLELRQIRLIRNDMALVERFQLYEDFARKLWKAYKDLTQKAAVEMGFNIGFLFHDGANFEEGLRKFRKENGAAGPSLEEYLRQTHTKWQNDLADFRNKFLEHRNGERSDYAKFYQPQFTEALFSAVWRTIVEILVMLLGLRLPPGVYLIEQDPNEPGPRWPNRFQYHIDGFPPKS